MDTAAKLGLGASEHAVHMHLADKNGVCSQTRMTMFPLDASGQGSHFMPASTLMQTVGTSNLDIHNMNGIEILSSHVTNMDGPCGITMGFGGPDGDNAFVPLDTSTRACMHSPGHTDLFHHIATQAGFTPHPPTTLLVPPGSKQCLTTEQMGVLGAVSAWPKVSLEHDSRVTDLSDDYLMWPDGESPTLAAHVCNRNETNTQFLNGKYSSQKVPHPSVKGLKMKVVEKAHYKMATKIALDATTLKHPAQHGITTCCMGPRHVKATTSAEMGGGKQPMAYVTWRTLHPANPTFDMLDGRKELTTASLKANLGAGAGPSGPAPVVMSPESLAEHVRTRLNLSKPSPSDE